MSCILFALLLSPSPFLDVRNSGPGSLLISTSPPLRYAPFFLSREEFISFFPHRLASKCAYARYVGRIWLTHAMIQIALGSWCLEDTNLHTEISTPDSNLSILCSLVFEEVCLLDRFCYRR